MPRTFLHVEAGRPAIEAIEGRAKLGNARLGAKIFLLVHRETGLERLGESGVGFGEDREQKFLRLGRERGGGPIEDGGNRDGAVIRQARAELFLGVAKLGGEGGVREEEAAAVLGQPVEIGDRTLDEGEHEASLGAARVERTPAQPGESRLVNIEPGIDDLRMAGDEGNDADAGGIADAEIAAIVALERGGFGAAMGGQRVHEVGYEFAQQPGRHDLRVVGLREDAEAAERREGHRPELAVAIEGGGAEEIAGRSQDRRVRLAARGERGDRGFERARALVAAQPHQRIGVGPAGLLLRHLAPHLAKTRLRGLADAEHAHRVPLHADDAVGFFLERDGEGKDVKEEWQVRRVHAVERATRALRIERKRLAADAPALLLDDPKQRAREAERARPERAEAFGAHEQCGGSFRLRLRPRFGSGREGRVRARHHAASAARSPALARTPKASP